MSTSSERKPLKQGAKPYELRRSMNARRRDLSASIRKNKKSDRIQSKRRYFNHPEARSSDATDTSAALDSTMDHHPASPSADLSSSASSLSTSTAALAWTYMRIRDSESITALEAALARYNPQKDHNSSLSVTDLTNAETMMPPSTTGSIQQQHGIPAATRLANCLAQTLLQTSTTNLHDALLASRVLTNLSAMEGPSDGDSYYGASNATYATPTQSWSTIIVHESQALSALQQILGQYYGGQGTTPERIELTQQACWAIGNLVVGDSSADRDDDWKAAIIEPLAMAIRMGHAGVTRQAVWALCNVIKSTTAAARGGGVVTQILQLVPVSMMTAMIEVPAGHDESKIYKGVRSKKEKNDNIDNNEEWIEMTNEACWIVAYLTARDDTVVDAMLPTHSENTLIQALLYRLKLGVARVQEIVQQGSTRSLGWTRSQLEAPTRTCLPCLRAIGNIATACQGRHVPKLLTANNHTLVDSLSRLLENGCDLPYSDVQTLAVEAAWGAGALLCDAGVPHSPSTTMACPGLLPVLCSALVFKRTVAKLELKRECLSACWNMISAPPADLEHAVTEQQLESAASASRPIRDEFLTQLALTPRFVLSLVELILSSLDGDVVFLALSILNALLRRLSSSLPSVRREFLEADGIDVLDAVCDRASQPHGTGTTSFTTNDSADMAADLIDDLFGEDMLNDDDDMVDNDGQQRQTTGEATFSFGVAEGATTQVFDFGQPLSAQPAPTFPKAKPGHGRGRGKTIPAWMHQR